MLNIYKEILKNLIFYIFKNITIFYHDIFQPCKTVVLFRYSCQFFMVSFFLWIFLGYCELGCLYLCNQSPGMK